MTIEELCELVLRLQPQDLTSLNGAAAGVLGSSNSGADSVMELQRATLQFAKAFKLGDMDQLEVSKKDVIGRTMVVVALGALPEDKADRIIEAVFEITKGKK